MVTELIQVKFSRRESTKNVITSCHLSICSSSVCSNSGDLRPSLQKCDNLRATSDKLMDKIKDSLDLKEPKN